MSAGKTSNDFKYLNTHAPAEDMDFTGLAEVQDAIRELGIQLEEEKDVFKALGGLLHLGQVCTAVGLFLPAYNLHLGAGLYHESALFLSFQNLHIGQLRSIVGAG